MKKKVKKIVITLLCLALALTLTSCKNEQVEEVKEETKEVIKQEEVKEEKKEEPVIEETIAEEPKEDTKKQDITKMSFWVVFYDQYDNELQREALKYGTVPEYKTWLPEGFDKWVYKRSGKDVGTFKPITGNTYFKAVCREVYHEHHGSNEPAGPTISYTAIWKGNASFSSWGQITNIEYDWSTLEPGTILRVEFTIDSEKTGNPYIQFCDGWTVKLPGTENLEGANEWGDIFVNETATYYELELTQDMIDALDAHDTLIMTGTWVTVSSIKIGIKEKQEPSGPTIEYTTIWEGTEVVGGWSGQMNALSWGGYDWSTVEPGTILRAELTVPATKEYGALIRFGNGNWSALPGTKEFEGADYDGNIPLNDDTTSYEFVLTQAMIDEMVNNGGLVLCGAWFTVTAVKLGVKS